MTTTDKSVSIILPKPPLALFAILEIAKYIAITVAATIAIAIAALIMSPVE